MIKSDKVSSEDHLLQLPQVLIVKIEKGTLGFRQTALMYLTTNLVISKGITSV